MSASVDYLIESYKSSGYSYQDLKTYMESWYWKDGEEKEFAFKYLDKLYNKQDNIIDLHKKHFGLLK